jgi:hypothetical protein
MVFAMAKLRISLPRKSGAKYAKSAPGKLKAKFTEADVR